MRPTQSFLSLVLILASGMANAQVSFQSLTDRADNTVELKVNSSRGSAAFKGVIKPGDKLQARSGSMNADITRFADQPFIAVALTEDGQEKGYVFILERQNGGYVALNDKPITGKASSLAVDLDDAIKGLRKIKGDDTSLVMRALVNHFTNEPNTDLYQFADGLENGQQILIDEVKQVPTPGSVRLGKRIPPPKDDTLYEPPTPPARPRDVKTADEPQADESNRSSAQAQEAPKQAARPPAPPPPEDAEAPQNPDEHESAQRVPSHQAPLDDQGDMYEPPRPPQGQPDDGNWGFLEDGNGDYQQNPNYPPRPRRRMAPGYPQPPPQPQMRPRYRGPRQQGYYQQPGYPVPPQQQGGVGGFFGSLFN